DEHARLPRRRRVPLRRLPAGHGLPPAAPPVPAGAALPSARVAPAAVRLRGVPRARHGRRGGLLPPPAAASRDGAGADGPARAGGNPNSKPRTPNPAPRARAGPPGLMRISDL